MLLNFLSLSKIKLILIALSVSGAFYGGWKVNGWRLNQVISQMQTEAFAAQTEAEQKAREIERLNRDKSDVAAQLEVEKLKKQQEVIRYVNKEIIKYVQDPNAGKCELPNSWVRIHDTAASPDSLSAVPEASSDSDESASGITDIEALTTITDNYGRCVETREQLISLQEWVRSIQ